MLSRPASMLLRRAAVSGPLPPRPVTAVHLQQARFINLHEYQSVDVMGNPNPNPNPNPNSNPNPNPPNATLKKPPKPLCPNNPP
jgi:hypothetical protein